MSPPRYSCHGRDGVKGDTIANQAAFEKVCQDKLREERAGHDRTWVAHPGLVPTAKEVSDAHMKTPSQIHMRCEDVRATAADLLNAEGKITEQGMRLNIDVGIQYLQSWLRGSGCVPIYNLMEDAATAEISPTQVWQWRKYGAKLTDGRKVTSAFVGEVVASQMQHIRSVVDAAHFDRSRFRQAVARFRTMIVSNDLKGFLTLEAYQYL